MSASVASKKRPLPRARQACLRCRKQKLRCDDTRPCALCVRVGIECRERPENRSSVIHQRISEPLSTPTTAQSKDDEVPTASPHFRDPFRGPTSPLTSPPNLPLPIQVILSPQEVGPRSPEIYKERTSTYEVVDQLFKEHNSAGRLNHTADAIPGSSPDARPHDAGGHYFSVQEVLGSELPPTYVIEFCFESYLDAVHWFMLLFHEPSLRVGIEHVAAAGRVQKDRVSFLILVGLVIAVGAKYATKKEAEERCPGFDLDLLGNQFIRKAEERLLDVYDEAHIEAIQIAMILSSYYIYHSRPNRSLAMSGSAQKLALAMGLHKESSWKMTDPVIREVWRRLCWALYTAEV